MTKRKRVNRTTEPAHGSVTEEEGGRLHPSTFVDFPIKLK